MSFFVYIHTCPNQKRYVGVTIQKTARRWKNGKGYIYNEHFYRAINKYGWDNIQHEVFETQSIELMSYWERILIYHYNTMDGDFGYNKTSGGEINKEVSEDVKLKLRGRKPSEETKRKMSKSHKGKGHKHSDDTKKKISDSNKGRKLSEEHRQKLKGKKSPMKGRTPWNKGKKLPPLSEDAKKKMSEAKKGHKCSDETRKKMSETRKLYWENKRKIINE